MDKEELFDEEQPAIIRESDIGDQDIRVRVISNPDDYLSVAVARGASVDELRQLIELRNAEIARNAEIKHNEHFMEMKKEFEPVKKTKPGTKDRYKFAPISALQRQYDPIITKHGFSYDWDPETLTDGRLRVWIVITGYGHTKRRYVDMPSYQPMSGKESGESIMTAMQAEGVRLSYGYRYSFKAGFGITEEDEDTDGSFSFDEGVELAEEIQKIRATATNEALLSLMQRFWKEFPDSRCRKILAKVADEHKKEFSK